MRIPSLSLAALFAATTACREAGPSLSSSQLRAIDELVTAEVAANAIPGFAVAIVRNGGVTKVVRGLSSIAGSIPTTDSTPFQLASTTKSFTAVAVMLLVRDSAIRLDQAIGTVVSGLPADWNGVTIRQLLSHTSGLPDIVRNPGQIDLLVDTWDDMLAETATAPSQFAPGERWAYTQTNFVLLDRLVELKSGESLESFMQKRLFAPLGMSRTFYPTSEPGEPQCAVNYERSTVGQSPQLRALDFPDFVHAAGGLCSSIDDMVRWSLALDSGTVLSREWLDTLWTITKLRDGQAARIQGSTGYGLGWVVDDTPGNRWVGHSGGNSSAIRRYRDEQTTIVVLHNGTHDPEGLADRIGAIVRNERGSADSQASLWDASASGDTVAIIKALGDGADIEALDTRRSKNGRRALNWAAANGRVEAIEVLLAHGASINAANLTAFTALHHAAESGSLTAVQALLAAGADISLKNSAGEDAADVAQRKGHIDIANVIKAKRRM